MVWGRKGMARVIGKLAGSSVDKLAGQVDKESFLAQLKEAWRPSVKKHTSIEDELAAAMDRINNSGMFKSAFNTVGVTEDDIRTLLEEIREEKIDPVKYEHAKVGRNEPCPCGSGKKYKKCCGQ